jgi:hypothetical protein
MQKLRETKNNDNYCKDEVDDVYKFVLTVGIFSSEPEGSGI